MRVLTCFVLAALAARADASPRARQVGPAEAYRQARAECGKPGPRIAAFLKAYFDRWLAPAGFGARVIRGWDQLTGEQRARFEQLADARVLAALRSEEIRALCDRHDAYRNVSETHGGDPADPSRMVTYGRVWVTHHVGDDAFIIAWVLVEQGGQWRLDRVEVPSMDFPGIDEDPVSRTVRDQLGRGDFEHAMEVLARP